MAKNETSVGFSGKSVRPSLSMADAQRDLAGCLDERTMTDTCLFHRHISFATRQLAIKKKKKKRERLHSAPSNPLPLLWVHIFECPDFTAFHMSAITPHCCRFLPYTAWSCKSDRCITNRLDVLSTCCKVLSAFHPRWLQWQWAVSGPLQELVSSLLGLTLFWVVLLGPACFHLFIYAVFHCVPLTQ